MKASQLLSLFPTLPPTSLAALQALVSHAGDPEIHLPSMPGMLALPAHLPAGTGPLAQAAQDALKQVLGQFEFECYQTLGVQISLKGNRLVGFGAKLSETLDFSAPAPGVKVTPFLDIGPGVPSAPQE